MSDLHRVIIEHNPEADSGHVTWADMAIVRAMLKLSRRIDLLERQAGGRPEPAGLLDALHEWVKQERKDIGRERGQQAYTDGRAAQLANLVAFLEGYLEEPGSEDGGQ